MGRLIALIAFAAINATIVPALASECTLNQDVSASRTRWAMLRKQPANAADTEKACRAYAASFYESRDFAAGRRQVRPQRTRAHRA